MNITKFTTTASVFLLLAMAMMSHGSTRADEPERNSESQRRNATSEKQQKSLDSIIRMILAGNLPAARTKLAN